MDQSICERNPSQTHILITGSSRGIGRYLTEHYLKAGVNVIGCARSAASVVHKAYTHYQLDITNEGDVGVLMGKLRRSPGKIDVLINNAGVAAMNHFQLTPMDTARNVMNVNFFGTMLLCRDISRIMAKASHPRIINFTTVASPLNLEGEAVYAASKAAVEKLTQILARELASSKITVNAVGPVPIKTDLIANVGEERLSKLVARQAIKRLGEFPDVANVIDFYINPDSDFITGQILYLGGVS